MNFTFGKYICHRGRGRLSPWCKFKQHRRVLYITVSEITEICPLTIPRETFWNKCIFIYSKIWMKYIDTFLSYQTRMKHRWMDVSIIDWQTKHENIIPPTRAREIDKCKSVQPFHKQSAISMSFTETTNRPFPRSRKLPIGSFRNDRPFPDIR